MPEKCPSTPRPLTRFSSRAIASDVLETLLLEQSSFGHHNHVAGVQRNIAFQVLAGLVGAVIDQEDVFAWTAFAPNLNASLGGIGPKPASERNRLHQGGLLPHDLGPPPTHYACDD